MIAKSKYPVLFVFSPVVFFSPLIRVEEAGLIRYVSCVGKRGAGFEIDSRIRS